MLFVAWRGAVLFGCISVVVIWVDAVMVLLFVVF